MRRTAAWEEGKSVYQLAAGAPAQTCTHTAAEAPLVSLLSLSRSSSLGLPGVPRGGVGFMTRSKEQRDIGSGDMGLLSQGF